MIQGGPKVLQKYTVSGTQCVIRTNRAFFFNYGLIGGWNTRIKTGYRAWNWTPVFPDTVHFVSTRIMDRNYVFRGRERVVQCSYRNMEFYDWKNLLVSCENVQQCGLAGSWRSHDGCQLARLKFSAYLLQNAFRLWNVQIVRIFRLLWLWEMCLKK